MSEYPILLQFTALFTLAFILVLIFKLLKLSSILAFIITGIILGPLFNIVDPKNDIILFMREIGMLLIAFEIGLTVKLSFLRKEYPLAGLVFIFEIIIVFTIAFVAGILLNLMTYDIIIIALIAVNTSTLIAFKLMEEKGLIREFGGKEVKLTLTVATFEDLIVILSLAILPLIFAAERVTFSYVGSLIIHVIITAIAIVGIGLFLIKRFVERIYKLGEEIIFFFVISAILFISWLAPFIGFSKLLSAFLIGLLLSETRIAEIFVDKAKWVRDLFAFAFFVSIGLIIPLDVNINLLISMIGLIFIIIFSKFFAFFFSFWSLITSLRNSIRIGFYVINISEFGLIITSLAYSLGVISKELLLTSALAMIISNIISVTLINNEKIFVPLFEKIIPYRDSMEMVFNKLRDSLSYTNSKFLIFRKAFTEIIIIFSLIFAFSSIFLFLISYTINIQSILFKEIIVLSLFGIFVVTIFELFLSMYNIFKKLTINVFYFKDKEKLPKNLIYIVYFIFVLLIVTFIVSQSYIYFVKIFSIIYLTFQFNLISITLIIIISAFIIYIRKYLKKVLEEIQSLIKG
ncbi:MAG: cation:proton antiporter [Thermoproteota archaeon]|nr:cation:proton antiporter [Thermoproteota archaeon]